MVMGKNNIMGKISAVFVSGLTFGLFYYLSTILGEFEIGFDLPLYGWVQISQPFAELQEPTLIVGVMFSLIVLFVLWSKGSREAKT